MPDDKIVLVGSEEIAVDSSKSFDAESVVPSAEPAELEPPSTAASAENPTGQVITATIPLQTVVDFTEVTVSFTTSTTFPMSIFGKAVV
jgi:hypothetical protein